MTERDREKVYSLVRTQLRTYILNLRPLAGCDNEILDRIAPVQTRVALIAWARSGVPIKLQLGGSDTA